MKDKFIIILFLFSTFSLFGQAPKFNTVKKVTIQSKFLNESRDIYIGVPNNYDSTLEYSTLYVLDAETRFDITYALSKELFQNHDEVPELIVVGIPQIDWTHRKMDMTFTSTNIDGRGDIDTTGMMNDSVTGGGLTFLKHIEKEIIPYIDDNYSTNGFNTLVGHSLGGYFCSYILPIQNSFSAFQVYDGSIWYNSADVLQHLKKEIPYDFSTNVFISAGLFHEGPIKDVQYHLDNIDSLSNMMNNYPNINSTFKKYPKEDHVSMYMYSVIDGLSSLFKDCTYGFIYPTDDVNLAKLKEHYQKTSERLGFKFEPNSGEYRWTAYANFTQKKWQDAIDAYKACYDKYKDDISVNEELSICYKNIGKEKLNMKYLNKSIELKKK